MTFQPGQVTNPLGAVAQQEFTRALRKALHVEIDDNGTKQKRLNVIANKLASKACEGEAWAIGMVADRIDGRALQQVSASVGVDATSLFVEVLKRISQGHFNDQEPSAKVIEHQEKPSGDGVD
jgi:hypothetical protein